MLQFSSLLSRAMEAVNHSKNSAMETENHEKNGRSPKSLINRGKLRAAIAVTTVSNRQLKRQLPFVEIKKIAIMFLGSAISIAAIAQTPNTAWYNSTATSFNISTADQLAGLATIVNATTGSFANEQFSGKTIILASDINLSGYQSETGWTPIGNSTAKPFSGIFNGNEKIISNLKISNTSLQNVGLFGYIENCTVKDLGVVNVDIYSAGSGNSHRRAGCVVGYAVNCIITNCYTTGVVESRLTNREFAHRNALAGGIVGEFSGTNISYCYSTCEIKTFTDVDNYNPRSWSGGIVGYLGSGIVQNCYSTGKISSTARGHAINIFTYTYPIARSGGIAGFINSGEVSNCYSTGEINAATTASISSGGGNNISYAGGIVGQSNNNGIVKYCAALNSQIISTAQNAVNNTVHYGRVIGEGGSLSNNIAFDNMKRPDGTTSWNTSYIGHDKIYGESLTAKQINADGQIGYRFTSGWVTQNGKLPGFGAAVEMPQHLRIIPEITSSSTLQNGTVNINYNLTLNAIGTTPINWSIVSGSIPNGLTLSTSGLISGTPITAGFFSFTAKAENIAGSITQQFSITIGKGQQTAPSAPTLSYSTATSITLYTISGCEYRRDYGAWQASTTFNELIPNTQYRFEARKIETDNYFASPPSSAAFFYTLKP